MSFREDVKMSLSVIFAFLLLSTMTTPVGVHKNEMTDVDVCPFTLVLPPNATLVEIPVVINYVTCIHHSDATHDYLYDSIPASDCTFHNHDFEMVSENNGWMESNNGKTLEAMMFVEERWPKCSNDSMEWFDNAVQSDGTTLWQSLNEFIAPFMEHFKMPKIWKVRCEDVVKQAMTDGHDDVHYNLTVRSGYSDASGASVDAPVFEEDDILPHDEMTRYSLIRRQGFATPDRDEHQQPEAKDRVFSPLFHSNIANLGDVFISYGVLGRTVTIARR